MYCPLTPTLSPRGRAIAYDLGFFSPPREGEGNSLNAIALPQGERGKCLASMRVQAYPFHNRVHLASI
jgi:hypothetical protein